MIAYVSVEIDFYDKSLYILTEKILWYLGNAIYVYFWGSSK